MGYVSALMKTIVPILSIAVDAYFIEINKRFKPQKIKKKKPVTIFSWYKQV